MGKDRVAVVGVGQTKHQATRGDISIAGLVREAADRALVDAGVGWRDIDAVVVGKAPDLFEGVMKPELYLTDALGAAGKPMFRVHTAGSVGGTTGMTIVVLLLIIAAIVVLGLSLYSELDLWLLLALWGWFLEVTLIALESPANTAGWYAARGIGLLSSLFVLFILVVGEHIPFSILRETWTRAVRHARVQTA